MDGIDAAIVRLTDNEADRRCEIVASHSHPYPASLRTRLLEVSRNPGAATIDELGHLDRAVGECFRDATLELLRVSGKQASEVTAIGSHGQTLRHRPDDDQAFSLQIGDPNIIAHGTSITTVADFRRRDIAAGGQGAPLAPAFHRWLFAADDVSRIVLNLGGIANITILTDRSEQVAGFDTGPANTLMDAWTSEHRGISFDRNGDWARQGTVSPRLLTHLLDDDYFRRKPPKSTGFEYFNLDWLRRSFGAAELAPVDVQATLLALTVESITAAIRLHARSATEVLVCGGGIHNTTLMESLANALAPLTVTSTTTCGIDPDCLEAAAFAWLASRTLSGKTGNLPSVTGAKAFEVLGGVYLCAR